MIITDTWGDHWDVSLSERTGTADPANIEPLHEVRDAAKLEDLTASMERDGWQGRAILVSVRDGGYFAYTGSHRIAAARAAGLEQIPVVVIEIAEERTDDEPDDDDETPAPEYDAYGRIEMGLDDDDRFEALLAWSLPMSLGLMGQEIAQNQTLAKVGIDYDADPEDVWNEGATYAEYLHRMVTPDRVLKAGVEIE